MASISDSIDPFSLFCGALLGLGVGYALGSVVMRPKEQKIELDPALYYKYCKESIEKLENQLGISKEQAIELQLTHTQGVINSNLDKKQHVVINDKEAVKRISSLFED